MNMRICLFIAAMLVAAILSPHRADAQVPPASDDPLQQLQHGHALLIGIAHYRDRRRARLDNIPLQLTQLAKGLKDHFDTVEVVQDLEAKQLRDKINDFVRTNGNDSNARLFIYYAGHGYTEIIPQRNENRTQRRSGRFSTMLSSTRDWRTSIRTASGTLWRNWPMSFVSDPRNSKSGARTSVTKTV
jgi:Caspase domain